MLEICDDRCEGLLDSGGYDSELQIIFAPCTMTLYILLMSSPRCKRAFGGLVEASTPWGSESVFPEMWYTSRRSTPFGLVSLRPGIATIFLYSTLLSQRSALTRLVSTTSSSRYLAIPSPGQHVMTWDHCDHVMAGLSITRHLSRTYANIDKSDLP